MLMQYAEIAELAESPMSTPPAVVTPTKPKKKKSGGKQMNQYTAKTADPHTLYQEAVQCPEVEVKFLNRIFKNKFGRKPESLREDFCGTSLLCCEWVKNYKKANAIGVDLDPAVLRWGVENNLAKLKDRDRERIELIENNVMTAETEPVDVLVAFNFSYFLFQKRAEMLDYYRSVYRHLKEDGLFVVDCYGGYESQDILEEDRACNGFSYVWDQSSFNPVTGETTCYIHFHFPDDTSIKKAFTYTWRLWTLPEIREMMEEVGFKDVTVYWEGTDNDTDEGNGVFKPTTTGEVCPGWIAYVVAQR